MDRTGLKLCALAHKHCSTSLRLKSFSQSGSGAVITTAALYHLHVLGPTGTGKSTLLINLLLAARLGYARLAEPAIAP